MQPKAALLYNEAFSYFDNLRMQPDGTYHMESDPEAVLEIIGDNESEYENILQLLSNEGFLAVRHNVNDSLEGTIEFLRREQPDVIFNFVEVFGNTARLEMSITGVFDLLGFAYTGASPVTLSNCQNKLLAKKLLNSVGIKTPSGQLVREFSELKNFILPAIVKPAFEDASVGIDANAVVYSDADLASRIEYCVNEFKQPALVEQYIVGRELNISLLGNKSPKMLAISEIDFSTLPENSPHIVSYQAKWEKGHELYHQTIPVCPAQIAPDIVATIEQQAKKAYKVLGLRDYARFDLRMDSNNEIYFIEANPNPDLSQDSGFVRSALASGFTYGGILAEILKLALARK